MSSGAAKTYDFDSAKARLEEIADAVSDDSLSLDEALDLFEEAVSLGLTVSDLVEEGIVVEDDGEADQAASEPQPAVVGASSQVVSA